LSITEYVTSLLLNIKCLESQKSDPNVDFNAEDTQFKKGTKVNQYFN